MSKERQYVVNERGEKIAVVISIKEYAELLEEREDLQAVREYEEAKVSGETAIPLEQALAEIPRNHKCATP